MLQEARGGDQEEGDGKRADNPGQLRPRSCRFRHRGARRTAADWKSLEKSGGEVCGAESNHFLIGIDRSAKPRSVRARQDAGVGE